ncbi:MAG: hypothetical protein Q8S18_12835 [Bacteroidales bacterium]|nr:hypothetical protein [Bacteroidales bacterium]
MKGFATSLFRRNNFYFDRFKDSLLYMGASLIKLPIAFVTSPIFARNLSLTDFAAIGYFNTLSTFLMPVIALMFYNYYMTAYHSRSTEENKTILQSLVSFLLIIDVLIVSLSFIVLKYYLISSNSSFNAYPLGLIAFITAMFNMSIGFWGIKLRFERKSVKFFILQTSNMLLSVGMGIVFVVTLKLGAVGRLLPNMIFNILLFVLFFKVIVNKFSINWNIVKKAWLFCYPMVISGLLALPIMYLDKMLIERIHNNSEFGLYNIAFTIAGYFGMVTVAIFQAFQPDIFKLVESKQKVKLIQMLILIILIYIVGGGVFYGIAPWAVDYLTAGLYYESIKYLLPNLIIFALQPTTYFLTYIIIALKMPKLDLMNQIIIGLLSLVIYSLLIIKFQYFGALYGKILILIILLSIISLQIYYRKTRMIKSFISD